MTRFLQLHLALGKRYKNAITTVKSLDRFLNQLPRASQELTAETFNAWCRSQSQLTSRVRRNRMYVIRKFCWYRRRTVPGCFVPEAIFFPPLSQTVTPYIFSETEVAQLMKAAAGLQRQPYSPLRPELVRLSIVLLYTTGLRIGELLRLAVSDFDAREGTLLIRDSKFHKSRILPLPADVIRELEHYLRARRRHSLPVLPSTPFIGHCRYREKAYTAWGFQCCLWPVLDACNIRTRLGRRPRIHDFRHSCAVNTIIRWYRCGADVWAKLPFLSAYLGHVSISSTYRYLHFVEPLRAFASKRFADSFGGLIVPLARKKGDRN